eukprot:9174035-Karenia_brevis.AAC.1
MSSVRQGCNSTSRMLLLDKLFADAGCHAVCIQEGRIPQDGQHRCTNYTMYRSGATQWGAGGVQIWIINEL